MQCVCVPGGWTIFLQNTRTTFHTISPNDIPYNIPVHTPYTLYNIRTTTRDIRTVDEPVLSRSPKSLPVIHERRVWNFWTAFSIISPAHFCHFCHFYHFHQRETLDEIELQGVLILRRFEVLCYWQAQSRCPNLELSAAIHKIHKKIHHHFKLS